MRELRLVLLGLAAVIAIVLGAGFLRRALTPRPVPQEAQEAQQAQDQSAHASEQASATPDPAFDMASVSTATGDAAGSRGAIERAISEAPDYRSFFAHLRAAFPRDYDTILANEAAMRPGAVDVDAVTADTVTALRRVHGTLATKAPDGALAQIFAQQLREMEALGQRDPHLCVAFLYGSNGNGFLSFAAANRPLVAAAAAAGLDAMVAGGTAPVVRTAPTDADFDALEAALVAKGLSRPTIEALLDGKSADPPIADPEMCQSGQTYLRTLAEMPTDARGRLYGLAVDLMARS